MAISAPLRFRGYRGAAGLADVEIEPLPMEVKLERSGSLAVAVPVEEQPPVLTQSDVAAAVAAVRTETPDSR
ncbi:MAG: hypothetical protein OXH15_14020 [Gammaproteobacteria bacterium]|nr:hypothetical protein [Gammaproteobacteria bacterium]